jgi:hypothetical protein
MEGARGDGGTNWLAVKGIRFQVSGFRFQVSGFRFQVSGFRFQVSGFRFQVSGFRFQVSEVLGTQLRTLADKSGRTGAAEIKRRPKR